MTPPDGERRVADPRREVGQAIHGALAIVRGLPDAAAARARLEEQIQRLERGRFRLAAVGQFKRGKSTLLNALIGGALLPAAAVPATAVTTFVGGADGFGLTLGFIDGHAERVDVADLAAAAAELGAMVTEAGNPGNARNLDRVEVTLPSALLGEELVLVDTPGIGSTHRHNTDAGRAALAACDAALVVFSADLPITEVEVAYLAEIRAAVPTTLVAMTKADLAQDDDRGALLRLLGDRLAEGAPGGVAPRIWVVSARDGLAAKTRGDADALARSGLAALERHLVDVLVRHKEAMLVRSAAAGALRCVGALRSTLALRHAALELPLTELDRRIGLFEAAVRDLDERRRTARDLLVGDHRRAAAALDAACDAVHVEASTVLRSAFERVLAAAESPEAARGALASAVTRFFEEAKGALFARVRADVASAVQAERLRRGAIMAEVAGAAEAIMAVERRVEPAAEAEPPLREPYWVAAARADTLGSLTADGILRVMPRRLRDARALRSLRAGFDATIVRNLSSLQWALRQWLDDAVRGRVPRLDAEVEAEIAAVRTALAAARRYRGERGDEVRVERDVLAERIAVLQTVEVALTPHATATEGSPSA